MPWPPCHGITNSTSVLIMMLSRWLCQKPHSCQSVWRSPLLCTQRSCLLQLGCVGTGHWGWNLFPQLCTRLNRHNTCASFSLSKGLLETCARPPHMRHLAEGVFSEQRLAMHIPRSTNFQKLSHYALHLGVWICMSLFLDCLWYSIDISLLICQKQHYVVWNISSWSLAEKFPNFSFKSKLPPLRSSLSTASFLLWLHKAQKCSQRSDLSATLGRPGTPAAPYYSKWLQRAFRFFFFPTKPYTSFVEFIFRGRIIHQ